MNDFNIFFLGCFYPPFLKNTVLNNSKKGCQFAADNLQWSFIEGFIQNDVNLYLYSCPLISTYPLGYKQIYFKGGNFIYKKNNGYCSSFLNLPFLKKIDKEFDSQIADWHFSVLGKKYLFLYSLQTNLMKIALRAKRKYPDISLCLIIPDLPEYMGCNKYYKILGCKKRDNEYIYKNIILFDFFVLLTDYMKDKLGLNNRKSITIEGIYSNKLNKIEVERVKNKKIIFYSGNINRKYGIKNLIDAFMKISDPNYRLWIRGDGDMLQYVIDKSSCDMRIKYINRIPQEELYLLQQQATILVNPISNNEESTKYFFPSKTLEYLASGTPTLMYKLDCLPREYEEYIYFISEQGVDGIKKAIVSVCEKDPKELYSFGKKAAEFVGEHKNPKKQILKILDAL